MTKYGFEYRHYQCENPAALVIYAHGAGAGNQHEFNHQLCNLLCDLGLEVVSFNFPYMQTAYELEKKRPPNTNKILVEHFNTVVSSFTNNTNLPIFIAGKSMGGRIASQLLADGTDCLGAIVYGYPFIPPGKPEKLTQRMAHFEDINKPMLILQGQRDTFGNTNTLKDVSLPKAIELSWVTSGDHSFKPLKSSGLNEQQNIADAATTTKEFISRVLNEY